MDISHDHTDFGAQIPFLGYEGLDSPFSPPFFLAPHKIEEQWIFVYGKPYFRFLSPKSIFVLQFYKNSRSMEHHQGRTGHITMWENPTGPL
jgi:hypothetical protein